MDADGNRVPGFNPTRVRLKLPETVTVPLSVPTLQPHKGSSETIVLDNSSEPRKALQPHKGSSETAFDPRAVGVVADASTPQGFV